MEKGLKKVKKLYEKYLKNKSAFESFVLALHESGVSANRINKYLGKKNMFAERIILKQKNEANQKGV